MTATRKRDHIATHTGADRSAIEVDGLNIISDTFLVAGLTSKNTEWVVDLDLVIPYVGLCVRSRSSPQLGMYTGQRPNQSTQGRSYARIFAFRPRQE